MSRKWNAANPDKLRKIVREWRLSNPEKHMLSCVKYRAKKAGVPFNLELSDIVIPAVCPVLNIPIRKSERAIAENSPSMDKIFPELGYVKGNVRVISQLANVMKNSATLEQCVLLGEDASRLMAAREVHDASI